VYFADDKYHKERLQRQANAAKNIINKKLFSRQIAFYSISDFFMIRGTSFKQFLFYKCFTLPIL